MTIEVRTLGQLTVRIDGTEVAPITTQPVRAALVVYLALERSATRDAVMACIWAEAEVAQARHTLSQTLYQLRLDLGDRWLETAGTYLRATSALRSDAVEFAEAVEAGRHETALALYGGPFLDGCHLVASAPFEAWIDRHRARLIRLHHRARRERIGHLVAGGDLEGAVTAARRWVEVEPLEDEAQQHLIRLLGETGAGGEALRQYADFARHLAREELEPQPETTALADTLRRAMGTEGRTPVRRPLAPPPPMEAAPTRKPRRWRAAALAAVGSAVLLAAGLLLRGGRAEGPIRSVAVLPFENLGGDSADAYFVDGMHEALIADLSRVSDLRVISRTSVLRYRGTARSVPVIGRALQVDAVVEGSVLKAGDSVRVQASLIAAATDRTMGTVIHVAALTDVLGLLRDVARRIAGEFAVVAAGPRGTGVGRASPVVPAAYEAYLRARHLLNDLPRGDVLGALRLYRTAIELDTTFGLAHAGVAQARVLLGFFGAQPPDSTWRPAREAALRALALDDALADAHTALGYIALYDDWDWQGAERALHRALWLNPNDAMARHGYADLLTLLDRAEDGLRQVELGRAADPLSPLMHAALVGHLYLGRHFEEVLREVPRYRELVGREDAGQSVLSAALWQLGRRADAVEAFRRGWTEVALRQAVDQGEAEDGPEGAMRAAADYGAAAAAPDPYQVAAFYARAGRPDSAFRWLDRSIDTRGPAALHAIMDPVFDHLRDDPRFAAIRRRLGLPPG